MPRAVWWASWTFVGLVGFSRVSFGLLLPFVKHDYPATYGVYGTVAAANFAGYLVALIALPLVPRAWQTRRANTIAIGVIALTLAASGLAPDLVSLAVARFVNGLAQGVATILTIGLTLALVEPAARGRASGILWGGGGIGIALAGGSIPIAAASPFAWRWVWLAMAVLVAFGIVGLHRSLPDRMSGSVATDDARGNDGPALVVLGAQYTLFGLAFGAYISFAPAFAHALVSGAVALAIAWIITGASAAVGSDLWGRALDRSPRGLTLAICLALGAVGTALLLAAHLAGDVVSAILFGSSSVGGPAQTSALTRRYADGASYVRALSLITMVFAVGQTVGALVGGRIADLAGLGATVSVSSLLFAAAALAALLLLTRPRRT
jgi:predicted MFS family arabinose efflux permease